MMLPRAFSAALGKYHHLALALLACWSFVLYFFLSQQNAAGDAATIKATLRHFFVIVAALFALLLIAAMIIRLASRQKSRIRLSLFLILLGAVLFRAALVGQSPWLSNDIYRYLWDGRLVEYGINPYTFAPQAEALAPVRDAVIYPKVDHKNVHSVYPPLLQIFFWTGYKTSQAFGLQPQTGLKMLLVLIDIGLVLFLFRLLALAQIDPRWAILYAWHPLPIIEIAGSGHTDGVGAFTLALMAAFLMQRRFSPAAIFLALGFLIKFITILFLPFLFVAAWKSVGLKKATPVLALVAVIIICSYAPFVWAGESLYSGLLIYSEKWRFNDGFFSLVFTPVHWLVPERLVKYLMIPPDWVISATTLTTRRIDLALIIAKLIVAGLFLFIYLRLLLPRLRPEASRRDDWCWPAIVITILAAFLLLSPTLQPWYLVWMLPVLCLQEAIPAGASSARLIQPLWALSATVFLSYWVLANYLPLGWWQEPSWVKWVEYGIPCGMWLLHFCRGGYGFLR